MFAILPSSVAYSEKDNAIWTHLNQNFHINIISETKEKFINCSPNVLLVSLKNGLGRKISLKQVPHDIENILCFKGKISMHEIGNINGEYPFLVHSTNLNNNELVNLKHKETKNNSIIIGPALLLPRVGKPNIKKIVTIHSGSRYVLSDCVIGLSVKSDNDAEKLKKIIFQYWADFADLYKGTAAQYLTVNKIKIFLGIK